MYYKLHTSGGDSLLPLGRLAFEIILVIVAHFMPSVNRNSGWNKTQDTVQETHNL